MGTGLISMLLSLAYVKLVGVRTPEEFRHHSAAQQRKEMCIRDSPCSLASRGVARRSCLRGSGGGEGVSLSELVVPVLLCFTACYALGKRVDVYTCLLYTSRCV